MPRTKRKKAAKKPPTTPKNLKFFAIIALCIFFGIISIILIAGGFILNCNRDKILDYVDKHYSGQIGVGDISGNFFSGLVLEDLYFLHDKDNVSLPVWTGDKLTIKYNLSGIFSGKFTPGTVILDGFVLRIVQQKDGSFKFPQLIPHPVNAQGGQMNIGNFKIIVKNSRLDYNENEDFINSPLNIEIKEINATANYHDTGKLRIRRCNGKFLESNISIRGEIETNSILESSLNLEIDDIGLWQLAGAMGHLFPSSSKLRPTGECKINAKITGPLAAPKLEGTCQLDNASIGNFNLKDTLFQIKYLNKNIQLSEGIAKAYNGRISLEGNIDASQNPPTFELNAEAMGFDLGNYISELENGLDPVSGSFDGKFSCKGDFVNLSNLVGKGELHCNQGMYLNPFKGADTGFLGKRQEKKMGFKSLDIDFNIEQLELLIDSFRLESNWIEIIADGLVEFSGTLNIQGTIIADSELFKANEKFNEITSLLSLKNVKIPVKFKLLGEPSDYVLQSAFPKETIERLLGDNAAIKQKANDLLENYFGKTAQNIPDILPDIQQK
ncbi:MAG: AsmA-like C-terminal region-containing protein [bacterium]